MPSAQFIQNLMAKTRTKYGGTVSIGDQVFAMTTRSLEPREREYLPEGVTNAADADLRVFCMTPSDFPVWPALDSMLVWESIAYTIIAVRPGDDVIGSTPMKLEFFVYRTVPKDSATTVTTVEAAESGKPQDAGKRVAFHPVSTNTPENTGS